MSTDREPAAELFGLADSFPHRGWVILDAARDHRFTGELIADVAPPVRLYFDRGEIYLAERSTEPPLGVRLIDAGALNAAQLEHGSMVVGEIAHLGRLFERVPSIDKDVVLLMTEMMNDECVAWVAAQDVAAVTSTPYLHHPSGIHRWHRSSDDADLRPGDQLPAPPPTAAPVEAASPIAPERDADTLIAWGDPATGTRPPSLAPPAPPGVEAPAGRPAGEVSDRIDSILESDWADRLETHGLPDIGSDPLAVPSSLPPVPTGQRDRFELIWPSGEIDEQFDAGAALDHLHERDHDRAGPTARVVRARDVGSDPDEPDGGDPIELWDFESTGPSFGPPEDRPVAAERETVGDADYVSDDPHLTVITDDAVLSMRRAVESIEAASVTSQPSVSLADTSTTTDSVRSADLVLPGRVATRTESSVWSIRGFENATNRSVFDETTPLPTARPSDVVPAAAPVAAVATGPPVSTDRSEAPRLSALRRLIGGLRFR